VDSRQPAADPAGKGCGKSTASQRLPINYHSRVLERALAGPTSRGEANCADLAGSLVGSLRSERRDLSTNKKLIADAMVSNARRGRKRYR